MKIKEMSKDELEMISFDDLAYMILVESKKKLACAELMVQYSQRENWKMKNL